MAIGRGGNRRRADSAQRADERKATARRAGAIFVRLFASLVAVAVLAVGCQVAWDWATTAACFGARQLAFSGLSRATSAELLKISGLAAGQNLFRLEPAQFERAMAAHPWVKSVEVRRRFPSSVSVTVVEHHPAALISLGELYLLDEAGDPFKRVQGEDAVDLPLVTGLEREEYVAQPRQSAAKLSRALELVRAYGDAAPGADARLSEVRLSGQGVTLVTGQGQEVLLPDDPDAESLTRLARVRAELDRRGLVAEVIHLDNRARPGWVSVRLSAPRSERTGGPRR